MIKIKKLGYLFVCAVLLVLAACGSTSTGSNSADTSANHAANNDSAASSGDKIRLSYAFFSPPETYPGVVAQMWADELKERTNGRVETEIYFSGTLLDASNMLDGVANGIADIGLMALSYEPGKFPLIEIAEINRGLYHAESASQIMNKLIEEYPPEVLQNYEILKVFTTDGMAIMSIDPISSLETIKGKQLRIGGALTPVLERLGAVPVGMSQAESIEALQTGVIDGTVGDRQTLKTVRIAEMVNYFTDYPLAVTTLVAIMNKDKYNSLPDDVKQVLQEMKQEYPAKAGRYLDENMEEAIQWAINEHGVQKITLDPAEKEKWDNLLIELQNEYIRKAAEQGLPAEEFKARLDELVQEYAK